MALLPNNITNIGDDITIVSQPTLTYYLDLTNNRIFSKIDGLEAMKQAIFKILQTERYGYLIYDWNYGVELENLIGKDPLFVLGEIERVIVEALKQDDRIISITNFNIIKISKTELSISFTANTSEGEINIEGVSLNV